MQMIIDTEGTARCIYAEDIPLSLLGLLSIERASHVEPDSLGQWCVSLAPVGGPILGPFTSRSEALDAEHRWLIANWL
jgi:hypothetical protein